MKTACLDRKELLLLALNHLYPHGNVTLLREHARLEWRTFNYQIIVDLPKDHWAFWNQEEPPSRYYARRHGKADAAYVIDTNSRDRKLAHCEHFSDAATLTDLLNKREEQE